MVCLGNICRSPLAQAVLESKVDPKRVWVDSAGTSNYHVGNPADERSVRIGEKHNLNLTEQRARQFEAFDFDKFDRIYVMDSSNYADVLLLARNDQDKEKVSLILDVLFPGENRNVPDPYFGQGEEGFQKVYEMLDRACAKIATEFS